MFCQGAGYIETSIFYKVGETTSNIRIGIRRCIIRIEIEGTCIPRIIPITPE
jgi:hypothetical protein